MILEVILAELFGDLVDAPEFAVDEDDAFIRCLGGKAAVGDKRLVDGIAEEGIAGIIAAVAQDDAFVFADGLAVLGLGGLAVKEIKGKLRRAVILPRIDIEALLRCGTRGSALDADADILRENLLSVLKEGEGSLALPFASLLGVVGIHFPRLLAAEARPAAPASPGILAALVLLVIDLAEAIDTGLVIKEIVRIGHKGNDLHGLVVPGIRFADKIGARDRITDASLCIHGDCTDDGGLIHIAAGRIRTACGNIGFRAQTVGGIGHVLHADRRGILFGIRGRIAAVGGIVHSRSGGSSDRQIEGAVIEAACCGEFRELHGIRAFRCGIGIAGGAGEGVPGAGAVGILSVGGIGCQGAEGKGIHGIAGGIGQGERFAGCGKTEGRIGGICQCGIAVTPDHKGTARRNGGTGGEGVAVGLGSLVGEAAAG